MSGRCSGGERHVRFGLVEPGGLDDGAADPISISRPGHRLDDQADQAEAMVRVFESGIGVDGRGRRQIGTKLRFVEERAGVLPLAAVIAIAHDAGTVRQQLCDRRLRNCRVKAFHVLPDAVVEREFALFAQLQDPGGGERLRMDAT